MPSKIRASCIVRAVGDSPGAMNWGSSVRKKTPSFGFRRADRRPCSHARRHVRAGAPAVTVVRSKSPDRKVEIPR